MKTGLPCRSECLLRRYLIRSGVMPPTSIPCFISAANWPVPGFPWLAIRCISFWMWLPIGGMPARRPGRPHPLMVIGRHSGGVSQYIAPVKIATPQADGSIIHQVQSGQSLWSIAIKYGVKIDAIRRLNNISADGTIYIGQKLIIQSPGQKSPTTVSKTETPSLSDFLPPKTELQSTAQTDVTQQPVPSQPFKIDPSGIFLILFALAGAGLVLVFIGMRR